MRKMWLQAWHSLFSLNLFSHSVVDLLRCFLLNWQKKLKSETHLFPGLSKSRSFRTDLPSISGGVSSPAISRIVGARSIFRTIWGTLWIKRKGHSVIRSIWKSLHIRIRMRKVMNVYQGFEDIKLYTRAMFRNPSLKATTVRVRGQYCRTSLERKS